MTAAPRTVVALACALALVAPDVRAAPPQVLTDDLNPNAAEHVRKAVEATRRGDYKSAEESFKRAAFYAPNWRPLNFNYGVLAEGQGKIGAAIRSYQAFRPYATPDEALLVDQRIHELGARRAKIIKVYRRQLIGGAILGASGLAAVAGGATLLGIYIARGKTFQESHGGYAGGGALLFIYGGLVGIAGIGVLAVAGKNRRKLDGLALGKARLHWAGGAGAVLRF